MNPRAFCRARRNQGEADARIVATRAQAIGETVRVEG